MENKSSGMKKASRSWLWKWAEPESSPTVLPRSKTERLALKAKLANIDAERAFSRAYQIELARTKAISEAMFKSGKALRFTLVSSVRQINLRIEAFRREIEAKYRNK